MPVSRILPQGGSWLACLLLLCIALAALSCGGQQESGSAPHELPHATINPDPAVGGLLRHWPAPHRLADDKARGDAGRMISNSIGFYALSADPMTSWEWDFGGGTTPGSSMEIYPVVLAGAPGSYNCSVTVGNPAGQSTFPFMLVIDPWRHSSGRSLIPWNREQRAAALGLS